MSLVLRPHEIGKIDPALFAGDIAMQKYYEQLDARAAASKDFNVIHYFLPLIDSTPDIPDSQIIKSSYTPSGDASRIVKGMASVKEPDRGKDEVEPKAYETSLKAFLDKNPIMFYNHGWDWPIGTVFEAAVTANGLYFEGELDNEDNQLATRVWKWVQKKIIRAISPSFRILEFSWKDPSDPWFGGRIIKSLELLEISLVTIPKQADALLDTYKGFVPGRSSFFGPIKNNDKPEMLATAKTLKSAQSAMTHLLCKKDINLDDESVINQFNALSTSLKEFGSPIPEKKRYRRLEIKELFEGKKYEFNLMQGSDGKLLVFENTTKCWQEFEKMPRFLKKHIRQSDLFQSLVKIDKNAAGVEKYNFTSVPVSSFVMPSVPNEILDIKEDRFSISSVAGLGVVISLDAKHVDTFLQKLPDTITNIVDPQSTNTNSQVADDKEPDGESNNQSAPSEVRTQLLTSLGTLKLALADLAKKHDDHTSKVETIVNKILEDKYRTGEIWHGR